MCIFSGSFESKIKTGFSWKMYLLPPPPLPTRKKRTKTKVKLSEQLPLCQGKQVKIKELQVSFPSQQGGHGKVFPVMNSSVSLPPFLSPSNSTWIEAVGFWPGTAQLWEDFSHLRLITSKDTQTHTVVYIYLCSLLVLEKRRLYLCLHKWIITFFALCFVIYSLFSIKVLIFILPDTVPSIL